MSTALTNLPFKWDIAPVPFNPKGGRLARVDADVFGIPKDAANKAEAWEVLKWLLQPDNNLTLCKVYGCMPARKSTEADYKALIEQNYPNVDSSVLFGAAEYLDVPNHESWVPEYGRVNEALANAQSQINTADQNHDAKSVLDQTNTEIQNILDEYWASHK
jgi:multiple sugar transport system substrate-binding protein